MQLHLRSGMSGALRLHTLCFAETQLALAAPHGFAQLSPTSRVFQGQPCAGRASDTTWLESVLSNSHGTAHPRAPWHDILLVISIKLPSSCLDMNHLAPLQLGLTVPNWPAQPSLSQMSNLRWSCQGNHVGHSLIKLA